MAVDSYLGPKDSSAQLQPCGLGRTPKTKKKKYALWEQLKKSQASPSRGSLLGAKGGKETWNRAGREEAREGGKRKKHWEPHVYGITLLPLPSCPAPSPAVCW